MRRIPCNDNDKDNESSHGINRAMLLQIVSIDSHRNGMLLIVALAFRIPQPLQA